MAKRVSKSGRSDSKPARTSLPRRPRSGADASARATQSVRGASLPTDVSLSVRSAGIAPFKYQVVIGHGLIARATPAIGAALAGRRAALIVVDSGLDRAGDSVEAMTALVKAAGLRSSVCAVNASERHKSLATLEHVLADAARLRLERTDCVIALGGGVVTDLAGFAAGVYRRGVDVLQFPSSLLAMVDAAVGGKTAVNLLVGDDRDDGARSAGAAGGGEARLMKNMVGAFHPARLVVCDTALLSTLPARELRSGLAECIKHALIGRALGDRSLWTWLEANAGAVLRLEPPAVVELVARNVACKARIVQRDERETSTKPDGGRMMLNLGHTFGHAIETLPGLSWEGGTGARTRQKSPLKHGEAIGLGLICACVASEELGLLAAPAGARVSSRVTEMLVRVGLPTRVRGLPSAKEIARRMMDDKKVASGRMRLVLPTTGGGCRVVTDVPGAVVERAIGAVMSDGRGNVHGED
jgi:3-dehydroquinate synthase